MNNYDITTEISDEKLSLFFDAKENGKSFPDALSAMGDVRVSDVGLKELHSLWDIHGMLVRSAHNISPAHTLLSKTLEGLSGEHVTNATPGSYQGESAPSAFHNISNNLNLIMNMNWKIVAPIAVVVIAVVAVTQMGKPEPTSLAVNDAPEMATMAMQAPEGAQMKTMAVMNTAPVSGNVDDLINSLAIEADADVEQFADASADIALVTADSQSINELNTAYDETTF